MKLLTRKLATVVSGPALILGLSGCALLSTDPSADQTVRMAVADPVPAGPALWKVADEDTTIYMFGTVHALPDDVDWYNSTIENALNSSQTVVTEIKMDSASEAAMQQLAISKGMLPAETSLRSLLSDEQTASYEAALTSLGMPVATFDRFKPWMAGLTLTMLPLLQQGYSADAGVDKVILKKASEKPQDALETAEFQIGIFDGMTQDAQIAFLVEAANGVDQVKPLLDAMVEEWVKGDADALAALMNEGMSDPEAAEALLYSRNRNWADWIITRLDDPGTVFMAVGAGHLAGEKSVQDYLEQRGIMTARVQ